MKKIKVSFLYESSKRFQNKTDSLEHFLWSLEGFIEKVQQKYPYLEKSDRIKIQDLRQSVDFVFESQIWVILITNKLIHPFIKPDEDEGKLFGFKVLEKIRKEFKKSVKLIIPVKLEEIDDWDSLPLSDLPFIDAIKEIDINVARQIREPIQRNIQLLIFEKESEQVYDQVDYSRGLDEINNFVENYLQKIEQSVCKLHERSFPKDEVLKYHNVILEEICQRKIEFDKRSFGKQRDLEESSYFESVEWPFEWDPAPYFPWIVGILIFAIFVIMSVQDQPHPTDYNKREEPKPTIVPFTNK